MGTRATILLFIDFENLAKPDGFIQNLHRPIRLCRIPKYYKDYDLYTNPLHCSAMSLIRTFTYEAFLFFEDLLRDVIKSEIKAKLSIKTKTLGKRKRNPEKKQAAEKHTHSAKEHRRWMRQLQNRKPQPRLAILDTSDQQVLQNEKPKSIVCEAKTGDLIVRWRLSEFRLQAEKPCSQVPSSTDDRFVLVAPSYVDAELELL